MIINKCPLQPPRSFWTLISVVIVSRCKHCQDFAKSYANIASSFHSSPSEKIRVAKVDCSTEKALMNRFGITGFPSLFLLDGYSVYEFEKKRTEANVMDFARGGYKRQESIPFWISPMGPMGQLQQFLIHLGIYIMDAFQGIQSRYGMSPILTGMILCGLGIFGAMISIILLTIINTPRAKTD
jgi:thiol-disulfide isomerase/thioredoxin